MSRISRSIRRRACRCPSRRSSAWIRVTALVIAGFVSFRHTPIEAFPDVTNTQIIVLFMAIALMVVWKHRTNIGRLKRGTEPKVGRHPESSGRIA